MTAETAAGLVFTAIIFIAMAVCDWTMSLTIFVALFGAFCIFVGLTIMFKFMGFK